MQNRRIVYSGHPQFGNIYEGDILIFKEGFWFNNDTTRRAFYSEIWTFGHQGGGQISYREDSHDYSPDDCHSSPISYLVGVIPEKSKTGFAKFITRIEGVI